MMRRLLLALALLAALPALTMLVAVPAGAAEPFGRGSWQAIRDAHAGRPLVVHLWSLTCAPCLAELPEWGELAARQPGLALVLISTDSPDRAPRMDMVLKRAGLGAVDNWAFADPFTERLRFEIDRTWRGELPRTLLVAPDGSVEILKGAAGTGPVTAWLARQENGNGHHR